MLILIISSVNFFYFIFVYNSGVVSLVLCCINFQNDYWQWKFSDKSIKIYYEEHEKEGSEPSKNMLMIPTISDVSTMEEWNLVVSEILQQDGSENLRATLVDWPGLGNSDRPKLDYTADVMEKFLSDLINSPGSPVCRSGVLNWLYFCCDDCSLVDIDRC